MPESTLARCLVIALTYLESRRDEEQSEDDDVRILEVISAELKNVNADERTMFIEALVSAGTPDLIEGLGLN